MHVRLEQSIAALVSEVDAVPSERRHALETLARFVLGRRSARKVAKLTFVCTHNSRRSHIAQLWATAAAVHYGIDGVQTYSGGTEATAFDRRAVAAMVRAGFRIDEAAGDNPHYRVSLGPDLPAVECFSKPYDADDNPREGFAAVMTCSQADESCPIVVGALLRVAIPYEDPKAADGNPQEAEVYDARVRQIGREMLYLFSCIPAARAMRR